jgi:hypothetical protein
MSMGSLCLRRLVRVTALALALLIGNAVSSWAQSVVPLYRWQYGAAYFWSTNYNEPPAWWTYVGITAYVYDGAATGTTPVYRYYNTSTGYHFYTSNWTELYGGGGNWSYEGIAYYVYTSQETGTVPLYRWDHPATGRHYYRIEPFSPGAGWEYEGIMGYVYSS